MAIMQQLEIPSGEGLTLEKLWAYLHASNERFEQRLERERAEWTERFERERAERTERLERERAEWTERFEREKAERNAQLEREKAERDAQLKCEKAERDAQLEREKAERDAQLEREKAERAERLEQEKVEQEKQKAKREEWSREFNLEIRKINRIVRENSRQIGGLNNAIGDLVESLVGPGTRRRFSELGYHFEGISPRRQKICGDDGTVKAEIDMLMENDDTIIAVEIKSRPRVDQKRDDISDHARRLAVFKEHRELRGEKPKRLLGAIAGAIYSTAVREATLKAGFFVLEQSGDTMLIAVPKGFVPKEW